MDNQMDGTQGKQPFHKKHLGEAIKALAAKIIDVFREYPVTMIAIVIAALLGAILIKVHDKDATTNLERAILFFLFTAMQTLFYEEIFPKKKVIRFPGYGVSAILSAIFVYIFTYTEKTLWGMEINAISETAAKILLVYGIIMVGFSVHHMFRRTEESFEVYATKSFFELLKASVVYGLFALGLALIIWVFNELIFDTDDLLEMVEIFLAAGIYVPMCLKAISSKHDEPGKFSTFCVLYILQPLQLIAFAIIYLYIIKIFITREDPSNKIFLILACLFTIGMPIWTMVHAVNKKDGILAKISTFLPYAFIPFLFLQIWSISIRIGAYGMTTDRYTCVSLIICEVIYLALYAYQHLAKKEAVSFCIYAAMIIAFFGFLCPGTSYDDVVIRSQMKRITKTLESETLNATQQSSIASAYRAIKFVGHKGEKALKNGLTQAQFDKIKEFDTKGYLINTRVYLSAGKLFTNVDVSAYRKIYKVTHVSAAPENGIINLMVAFDEDAEREKVAFDVSDYVKWVTEAFTEDYDPDFSKKTPYVFRINDKQDFFATSIRINFNPDTKEVNDLSLEGFLLEK